MASKDFQITSAQRAHLRHALDGALRPAQFTYLSGTVCVSMKKRGWLTSDWHYKEGDRYFITDLGRTVARQLGIVAEGGAT